MEILLGGENLLAEEGKAIGLVNRVFPRETFAADVQFFLAPFMKLSRVALLSTRRAIREAAGKPFDTALDTVEHIYLKELMLTDDAKEGLAAFLEKRQPAWRNS
jgi:cyclohexa-1,5-dienecarbonyl-CoA hydratase